MINAICVCVSVSVLLGIALFFHVVLKVTPEEGWATAVMMTLLLIYVAGLFGNTGIGCILLFVLGLTGLVSGIGCQIRKARNRLSTFVTPGILVVVFICLFGIIAFRGMLICNWDELYQWGKAANYMVLYDKLPGGADFSGEAILLSSTTFFHYVITKLSYLCTGGITESNFYVSNLVLWFGALILPFSGEGWKRWKETFAFCGFHFLLTAMIFVQPYYNIYTDQATAYWCSGLLAWFLYNKCEKKNLYLIPLVLVNVGLMKSMEGPLFAVIVILAIVLVFCWRQKDNKKKLLPAGWKKQLFSKKSIAALIAVLSPFLLVGIWSVITGSNALFRSNGGVVNPGEENRLELTVKAMLGWIFKAVNLKDDSLHLSYGLFFILTIVIAFVIFPVILEKKECRCYQFLMTIYLLGFAAYFAIMLVTYMKVFPYLHSIEAISLNRYYSDYMMLGVLPLTLPFFLSGNPSGTILPRMLKCAFIVFGFVYILAGTHSYILPRMTHRHALDTKKYAEREAFEDKAAAVRKLTNETGKIYFINQKKSGLFTLVADYELGDQIYRGGMCYKFREDTSKQISGLTDYSIYVLPEILTADGYEYVWVYSSNEYLQEKMSAIFGVKAKKGSFYKVVPTESGVKLEYMKKIK